MRKRDALMPLLQLSSLEDEGRELASSEPPIEVQAELAEMKRRLVSEIASLPEPYRAVYEMRDLHDLAGTEVARKLGISSAAMKSRLHRARALVRQQLDRVVLESSCAEQKSS
jgi:RNA polymerase sigma-70 factor (ECF subfamily)